MNHHAALRLTPSNSPFATKPHTPRSPTRPSKPDESGLHLTKVIGTTTACATAFACLPSTRQFAFTAGAAAVLATVAEDLEVTQQFFRASPVASSYARDGASAWPSTSTPSDARSRAIGTLKEHVFGGSPLSASTRDWADSPNGRSSTAKDRVKTATSVALSPNGKWLAVGETGYRPRVLVFSIKDGSSETPVALSAEHSFGVHALSFSPDSRFLASLGTVNDGFLYLWSVDDRTGALVLHSSNKCTTMIHSMCWMGQSIVTAGLRCVKVWRPNEDVTPADVRVSEPSRATLTPRQRAEHRSSDFGNSILSPKTRVLGGKNALLGDNLEATFLAILPISESKAILCAEGGEICLLDDTYKTQLMSLVTKVDFRISAARFSESGEILQVLGKGSQCTSFIVPELAKGITASADGDQQRPPKLHGAENKAGVAVIGSCAMPGVIVNILVNRMIELLQCDEISRVIHTRQLAAHEDPVLGVRYFESSAISKASFLTFSSDGSIRFWCADGAAVGTPLNVPVPSVSDMYGIVNELKAVVPLSDGSRVAAGDRYGNITLLDVQTQQVVHQVRAHAAEVSDLVAFERAGVHCLASSSRDRTVQLFACTNDTLQLLQTLDEHAGAVTGLLVTADANHLLSCSSDRSIVVREVMVRDSDDSKAIAFAMLRTVALKSTPTSFCLGPEDDSILVSTVDRCVAKYSIKGGQPSFSFKCSDSDNGEAVVMSRIQYIAAPTGTYNIAGVSSSDKSVRLYSEYGTLIARDWGHTEGITDMALIQRSTGQAEQASQPPRIVTVAADSTIFLWESLAPANRPGSHSTDMLSTAEPSAVLRPPLRKVISYSEMSTFRRERTADHSIGADPPSPTATLTPTLSSSPHKIRRKTSRLSVAPTPRLEPSSRPNFDPSRRTSLRRRSPSPPSPRNAKGNASRRPSLGMSLRSKSSDNVLNAMTSNVGANGVGPGSLTAATDSICRTLRAYRKKLATAASSDAIGPDALRELEKELRLTVSLLGERKSPSGSKKTSSSDEGALMARLLDRAGDRIVGMLDEKIKKRVETQVRKTSDGGPMSSNSELLPRLESPAELDEDDEAEELRRASVTTAGATRAAEEV